MLIVWRQFAWNVKSNFLKEKKMFFWKKKIYITILLSADFVYWMLKAKQLPTTCLNYCNIWTYGIGQKVRKVADTIT